MTKEFVVDYTDWHGRKHVFFCTARDLAHARSFAYWTLSDLIEIHNIQECKDVFFCHEKDLAHARSFAYWTLSDLNEIHSIQEYTDA